MFTISENGFAIMGMTSDFSKYAKSIGLRDPFKISQDLFSKRCRHEGTITYIDEISEEDKRLEPTRDEKDNYIVAREKYIAERVFNEIGYEEFIYRVNNSYNNCLLEWSKQFDPCNSADGQCSMYCNKFPCEVK